MCTWIGIGTKWSFIIVLVFDNDDDKSNSNMQVRICELCAASEKTDEAARAQPSVVSIASGAD